MKLPKWDFETTLVVVGKLVFIPIAPFCVRLGVQENWQLRKLKDDPDYAPLMDTFDVPSSRGMRETWCLQRKAFGGWLNGISPNKVRREFKAGLSQFRRDVMDAADRAFFGEVVDHIESTEQEVIVIEQGILAHGSFLESRVQLLEEDMAKVKSSLADREDEDIIVGAGQVTCPCGCGHIFSVRLVVGDE